MASPTPPITTVTSAKAWAPDVRAFSAVDIVPDALINVCTNVAGTVDGDQPQMRVAYVDDDTAAFVAEGSEITESEPALSEKLVNTAKVTQIVKLSNEQFGQEGTDAQLAQSVARAITRRANAAFIAEPAPTPPALAPSTGLINWPEIIDGGEVADNLDGLVDLVSVLQKNLSVPSHVIVDPYGWAVLRKMKTAQTFNSSLIGAGTTDAQQLLLSLPVIVDPSVPDFEGLIVDRNAIVSAVGLIRVATSEHQYFSSDSVLLRATWRFGHTVVRPNRIGKFVLAGGGS